MEVKRCEGDTLRYLCVEPDGYLPDGRYPLIILLHGYGSHMGDLASLSPAIDRTGYVYAFPNAPMPMQVGFGMVGYAWTSFGEADTDAEAQSAEEKLSAFFEEVMERYDTEPGQVVLGGFSQGGMMAYRNGLPNPQLFRGVAALSSRVENPDAMRQRLPASRAQSIFVSHGTLDPMIPVADGRRSHRFLVEQGYTPEYREYEMGHEISQDVVADLIRWLRRVLPPAGATA